MRPALICAAFLAAVLLLSITAPALADTEPAPAAPERTLSPMMQEIQDLIAAARADLDDLEADYRLATGSERDDLERMIADLKLATEIAVMETQLRYAAAEGRAEDVKLLEETIAALRGQRRPTAPPRPRAEPGAER